MNMNQNQDNARLVFGLALVGLTTGAIAGLYLSQFQFVAFNQETFVDYLFSLLAGIPGVENLQHDGETAKNWAAIFALVTDHVALSEFQRFARAVHFIATGAVVVAVAIPFAFFSIKNRQNKL